MELSHLFLISWITRERIIFGYTGVTKRSIRINFPCFILMRLLEKFEITPVVLFLWAALAWPGVLGLLSPGGLSGSPRRAARVCVSPSLGFNTRKPWLSSVKFLEGLHRSPWLALVFALAAERLEDTIVAHPSLRDTWVPCLCLFSAFLAPSLVSFSPLFLTVLLLFSLVLYHF